MKSINRFEVKDNIAIVVQHEDFSDESMVLIEKSINGKVEIPFTTTFNNEIKTVYFNEEYLVLSNREYQLNKEDFVVIALDTGKQVYDNKYNIYKTVSKVNKYGTFGVKSFLKK